MTGTRITQGLQAWFNRTGWRSFIINIPFVWLCLFFLLPFIIVVAMSLAMRASASPPFAFDAAWPYLRFDNFARLIDDSIYVRAFLTSISNAATAAILCLLLGYPMALGIARARQPWRNIMLMLVICHSGRRSFCASMPGWDCSAAIAGSTKA